MRDDPWIIRPGQTCDGCGACCMHMGVPPFDEFDGAIDDQDIEYQRLPDELKREIDEAWDKGTTWFVNKPCIWLDLETRKCRHYEHRPLVCERFEPGNPICIEDRQLLGIE